MNKMHFKSQLHYWTHMLDEAFPEDAMLVEGKHWPEDYIKAALNMLKKNGKHTEKSDVDVQKIADRFRKVLHGNAPLGYFNTVVRWYADDPDGFVKPSSINGQVPNDKLKAVLQHLLDFLNNQALVDKYSTQVKDGMSLHDFSAMMKEVSDEDAKNAAKDKFKVEDKGYKIIPIMSYEELHEKFGGDDKTGYYKIKGSGWCHTNGQSTYDYWTKNYTKFFFVIAKDNWKQIKPHENPKRYENAYDEYGLSLMAILVSDKGRLLNCTLRWNHVVEPKYTKSGRAVDKAFISFAELSQVTGLDVKVEVKQELAKLVEKFKNAPKGVKVYEGPEGICFASDRLYWYDRDLNPIAAPDEINGDFDCSHTSITSLEGCPKVINGYFRCSTTSITSLENGPRLVNGYFDCSNTHIKTLEGCPQIINGAFFCDDTKITSFEGGPREVGYLNCSGCKLLKSLKGAPAEIKNISWSSFPRKMKSETEKYIEWLKTNPTENYPG